MNLQKASFRQQVHDLVVVFSLQRWVFIDIVCAMR